ncbi:hypothetical protein A2U01_0096457, partial [Trifolium medium]|nr:hypothetical protein [Trifolium medium]
MKQEVYIPATAPCAGNRCASRRSQKQQLHKHADCALRDGERRLAPVPESKPFSCIIQ